MNQRGEYEILIAHVHWIGKKIPKKKKKINREALLDELWYDEKNGPCIVISDATSFSIVDVSVYLFMRNSNAFLLSMKGAMVMLEHQQTKHWQLAIQRPLQCLFCFRCCLCVCVCVCAPALFPSIQRYFFGMIHSDKIISFCFCFYFFSLSLCC